MCSNENFQLLVLLQAMTEKIEHLELDLDLKDKVNSYIFDKALPLLIVFYKFFNLVVYVLIRN